MTNARRSIALGLSLALLVGCNSTPKRDPEFAPVAPVVPPAQPSATTGSIFQAGHERAWFEDLRARRVGDILVVRLVEQTDASISNSTDVSQDNATIIDDPTLFGKSVNWLKGGNLGFNLSSSSDFEGEGNNDQSNALSGSLTVTVVEVMANGYLRVRGEKRIGTNGGNEYVKISGIVRPEDIDTTNTVDSTRIADATLLYVGDGQIADANKMGWLARFFISAVMPF
jgi:flagellar L-ring protein precursor FlgH